MIDGADRARFVEAKTELQKLVANEALQVGTCRSIDKQDVAWLIVSNKQDLPGCANIAEIEQTFELHTYWWWRVVMRIDYLLNVHIRSLKRR